MMYLRKPEVIDALVWWVHVQALGDGIHAPDARARLQLASVALLTIAAGEVLGEIRRADGGLDALGRAMAARLAALNVPRDQVNRVSAEATRAIQALALTLFASAAPEAPAPAQPTIAEPPNNASADVRLAYHAALSAVNAYTAATKAANRAG